MYAIISEDFEDLSVSDFENHFLFCCYATVCCYRGIEATARDKVKVKTKTKKEKKKRKSEKQLSFYFLFFVSSFD